MLYTFYIEQYEEFGEQTWIRDFYVFRLTFMARFAMNVDSLR